MGAAVAIEIQKPVDASDIKATNDLNIARNEVVRLRNSLGHLAKNAGFADVIYDGSDLIKGESKEDDFNRCVEEIIHIRKALQLSTQSFRRSTRHIISPPVAPPISATENGTLEENNENEDDDDSSCSSSTSSKSQQEET